METLLLDTDGDLVLGATDYTTVSGVGKIQQDLTMALTEPYGVDPFHPYWGSLLPAMVGQVFTALSQSAIQQEVMRVLQNYIAVQTAQLSNSLLAYDQTNYSTADIIASIDSVTLTPDPADPTRVSVAVALTTADGSTVSVNLGSPS